MKLTEAKKQKLSVRDTRLLKTLGKELAGMIIDRIGDLDLPIFAANDDKIESEVMKRLKAEVPGAFDSDGSLTDIGDQAFDRLYDEVEKSFPSNADAVVRDYLLKVISRELAG